MGNWDIDHMGDAVWPFWLLWDIHGLHFCPTFRSTVYKTMVEHGVQKLIILNEKKKNQAAG